MNDHVDTWVKWHRSSVMIAQVSFLLGGGGFGGQKCFSPPQRKNSVYAVVSFTMFLHAENDMFVCTSCQTDD
jgi:hypothetical protein